MFGPFQVSEELYLTPTGSVARARRTGEEGAVYVIKRFAPPVEDPAEPHWESAVFLDRARVQQQLVASGAKHWAAVHQVGVSDSGVWFATDYLPLSAQRLIDGKIEQSSASLYSIISAIVAGLEELKEARQRPHGNLKPSNVLLNGKDLDSAKVLLTDLGSPAQAAKSGEPGDVYAIGQILYGLAMHQAVSESDAWPLTEEAGWEKLGPKGPIWRQLCNDLLVPVASLRLPLDSVKRRLEELAPPRRKIKARIKLAPLLVAAVVLIAACATLFFAQRSERRRFAAAQRQWLGPLSFGLSNPSIRQQFSADPDLRHVIEILDREHLASLDASPLRISQINPFDWQRFRAANRSVAEMRTAMSPGHWARLDQAVQLKDHLENLAWPQPAEFVGRLIDGVHLEPVNTQIVEGIDRLERIVPRMSQKLPEAEQNWKGLAAHVKEIRGKNDRLLNSFADALRISAAAAVEVSDEGYFKLADVDESAALAEKFADAVRTSWPNDIDRRRLAQDVSANFDLNRLRPQDVRQFLNFLSRNTVVHDEATIAAAELRKELDATAAKVAHSHPDAKETALFDRQRADIAARILVFEQSPFTQRMIDDGSLTESSKRIDTQIQDLLKFYHPVGPEDWVRQLQTRPGTSDRINKYWEAWCKFLKDKTTIDEMAADRAKFEAYQAQAKGLYELLHNLDSEFPAVPTGLPEAFTLTARNHREQELARLLPLINTQTATLDPDKLKAAEQEFTEWTNDLSALAKDFPITREVLTLDDRPDLQWKTHAAFWNDPAIVALVAPDIDRINRLQALTTLGRADLIKTAQESKEPEIVLAAWELAGANSTKPAWPLAAGELASDAAVAQKLTDMVGGLRSMSQSDSLRTRILEQEPPRWRRFVENATSEAMIEEAINHRPAVGTTDEQLAAMPPAARYNFWNFVLHQGMTQKNDQVVRSALSGLRTTASELTGRTETADLANRIAGLETKEAFADLNPGDEVAIALPGLRAPMTFHRVDPSSTRPFYLATTEVSLSQFTAVIQSAGAWAAVKKLLWANLPGQSDTRKGPRVWEWTDQPTTPISSPQYWLSPDDDNDFAEPLRAGRFNRMVLASKAGGPPEPDHPMQQISAQGALFFAALCGCRLPSPDEWLAAYEKFEKNAPAAHWNLRDQTWLAQQKYAAQTPISHTMDDGIFRPEGDASPHGASATAVSQNDGILYFRHVNAAGDAAVFHDLVGNVAEFVCSATGAFERSSNRNTAEGVRDFAKEHAADLFVIGGSALSPPQVPVDKPLAMSKSDQGYADVGLRLAFTAPARTLAERVKWNLGEHPYLWPKPGEVQAEAK
ncbi:MAG TPA: SUMF1/EgtB/PvdO family nonheme iron enzyme [Humisphaera sp.]|jgi:formylglycine-generating enzyme required for sulfatase activity|nr:SUMF1/EgtB/PvdO family nonheme iron enzyme [Humisphaera sp.]